MSTPPPPTAPSFHPAPSKPRLRLPQGSCDAHCHVFGPVERFPFAEERTFTPADAPKEKRFALHAPRSPRPGVGSIPHLAMEQLAEASKAPTCCTFHTRERRRRSPT